LRSDLGDSFRFGMLGGGPVGVGALHPLFGEVLASVEVAVILIVIGTALDGNEVLSERAFRLLRWFKDRPEPTGPQ
jgi:hypothetical protein